MNRMKLTTRVVAILALVIVSVGCTTPTLVAPPTPDIPSVRTEAVQTVVAKLTIEAALNPSATPEPSQTPQPAAATAAPAASPTQAAITLAPTATPFPTLAPLGSSSSSGGNPAPTRTRRAGPDQAAMISQSPKDGAAFGPGNTFDADWTVKNIGTSKWTTGYEYRFSGGTNLAKSNIYTVPKSVAPGETVTLVADMQAPSQAGRYVSYWQLVNENGDVFYQFYIVIDVK